MSKERKRLLQEESCDAAPKRKKPRKVSRKRRPGFDEQIYNETTYYIKNCLRHVKPYYFTFTTHAKGRWVGSKVIDVFSQEFQSETPEFYKRALKAGKITVNGEVATEDTVIGHNELVCHTVHRHEPPVTAQPLTLIHNSDHLVVVDKPASIPVHPCGRYRHNSVVFLLAKEHNLKNLHTVHRLDRLTSGMLIFAKTVSKAQQLEAEIRGRKVTKVYVCRVKGEFPSEPVGCNEPILVVSHKLGVCRVDPSGKECSTLFTRLSFNGKSSVYLKLEGCTKYEYIYNRLVGFPIMNDPLYNHPAWKVDRAGDSVDVEHVISEIVKSNYASKSHDQPFARESEHETPLSSKPVTKSSSETLVDQSRTNDGEISTVCETVTEEVVGPKETQASGDGSRLLYTNSKVVTELVKEKEDEEKDPSFESDKEPDCSAEEICLHHKGENEKLDDKLVDCSDDGAGGESMPYDPNCTECRTEHPDPTPSELMMFLHALSYKGEGWEYSTAMPLWAQADWDEG